MKKEQEEIITKENAEENIQRVDKRPGSIYSIVIFVMVFLIGYLFYPQITMMIPVPGTRLTVETDYVATDITEMSDAEYIVLATAGEKGKKVSYVSGNAEPIVFSLVEFETIEVLKGQAPEEIKLPEYGGSALFQTNGRKQKFTVTYNHAAKFEKGETYLLFVKDGETINGEAGALIQNSDGTFSDATGEKYSLGQIRSLMEGKQ